MKRLYIIVEGQTEEEFIKTLVAPYLLKFDIYTVTPLLICTSKCGRGGFANYAYLKNDAGKLLASPKNDFIVSMFVDFFRCPELPQKERYEHIDDHCLKVVEMENCIGDDLDDRRFIPYIQLHEFEALLYSSNRGFEYYFTEKQALETKQIVDKYFNPELINSSPQKSPSKRLLGIKGDYDKVVEGNLIALEVGFSKMLERCPRFSAWIDKLIEACK